MKVTTLKIPDIKLIEPEIFGDERGYFYESFNQKKFSELVGVDVTFVQDNQSRSKKGVLRGLHYQGAPFSQGKLIRVVSGEVFDVAVDIRKYSPTYGEWIGEFLSDQNKKQLWIPEGFAHGFLTMSDDAELLYKATNYYNKKYEKTIHFSDNNFGISWPPMNQEYIVSKKDSLG